MNRMNKLVRATFLIAALTLGLVSCSSWGVPSAAKQAFERDFPQASRVEWDKEDGGAFEVEFVNQGIETKALYSADGQRELTEEKLRLTLLPPTVQEQLRTLFPGQGIDDIVRRTDMAGSVYYDVEVGDIKRIFSEDGTYLGPYDATMPQPAAPVSAEADTLAVDSL